MPCNAFTRSCIKLTSHSFWVGFSLDYKDNSEIINVSWQRRKPWVIFRPMSENGGLLISRWNNLWHLVGCCIPFWSCLWLNPLVFPLVPLCHHHKVDPALWIWVYLSLYNSTGYDYKNLNHHVLIIMCCDGSRECTFALITYIYSDKWSVDQSITISVFDIPWFHSTIWNSVMIYNSDKITITAYIPW